MAMSNPNSRRHVQVRIAHPEDAERIRILINSAFRVAEGFFVDEDRVDVGSVRNFLTTGKFLLAETEELLLGCVYVEPERFPANESLALVDRPLADPKQVDRPAGEIRDSPAEVRKAKFSRAYLGLLAVDPAYQQSGLGTLLMDAAEDHCRRLGASFMDIKVVSLREELFGYYRRRGYVETGTSPFPTAVVTRVSCHFIEMAKPLERVTGDGSRGTDDGG